jgi:hypothetical protein
VQSASYGVIPRGYPGWLASNAASCKSLKYWLAQQCSWPPALPVFPANREFYREFCKIVAFGAPETPNNGVVAGLSMQIPSIHRQLGMPFCTGVRSHFHGIRNCQGPVTEAYDRIRFYRICIGLSIAVDRQKSGFATMAPAFRPR